MGTTHREISLSKYRSFPRMFLCLLLLLIGLNGPSGQPALSEQTASPAKAAAGDQAPLYQPPKKITPRARVGGELRGTEGTDPEVVALVPDHVGITSNRAPVLNWFISKTTSHQVLFTLSDTKQVRPIYEGPVATPSKDGIYSIKLKALGLTLEPGAQYRWYVSVVRNPSSPSNDIVGGGIIEPWEMSDALTFDVRLCKEQNDKESIEGIVQNARNGFWYDAMGCLCNLIDAYPTDPDLRRLRARLLKDVGLNGVAEWDLRSVQAQQR